MFQALRFYDSGGALSAAFAKSAAFSVDFACLSAVMTAVNTAPSFYYIDELGFKIYSL